MKAILVIFTDTFIEDCTDYKKYVFNTKLIVKVGDIIKSPIYSKNIQVMKIYDTPFKYCNKVTNDLSSYFTSRNQIEIKELEKVYHIKNNVLFSL